VENQKIQVYPALAALGVNQPKKLHKNKTQTGKKQKFPKCKLQMRRVPPINANLIFRFNFWPRGFEIGSRKMWKTFNQIPMLIR